jgi:hypothetical protein
VESVAELVLEADFGSRAADPAGQDGVGEQAQARVAAPDLLLQLVDSLLEVAQANHVRRAVDAARRSSCRGRVRETAPQSMSLPSSQRAAQQRRCAALALADGAGAALPPWSVQPSWWWLLMMPAASPPYRTQQPSKSPSWVQASLLVPGLLLRAKGPRWRPATEPESSVSCSLVQCLVRLTNPTPPALSTVMSSRPHTYASRAERKENPCHTSSDWTGRAVPKQERGLTHPNAILGCPRKKNLSASRPRHQPARLANRLGF